METLRITFAIFLLGLSTLTSAKPIMVSFGTNPGPIVPREERTIQLSSRTVPRSPAPVSEDTDDIPNPSTYRPMPPHQYRTKLYSVKPPPNLVFGTPIDQRYTPVFDKFDPYQKEGRSVAGVDYTGPHEFDRQEYEIFEAKKLKTTLQPSVRYIKPHYYQQTKQDFADDRKVVPQIGVVFSSGVRYYVPQVVYYNQDEAEQENSVYDRNDAKYFYKTDQQ